MTEQEKLHLDCLIHEDQVVYLLALILDELRASKTEVVEKIDEWGRHLV